jgi:hypothetical protein
MEVHVLKQIKFSYTFNLDNILNQDKIIDCCIGMNGEVIILAQLNEPDRYDENGIGIFPKVSSKKDNHYRIYKIFSESISKIDIQNEHFNYHFIRDLGNETYLLACARSYYYNENKYDLNAHIYDCKGEKLREFLIGDGIQDIKVTKEGTIWTSYFDEGIFGNYGWENPIGSSGLRAWDTHGNSLYSYDPANEEYSICDCYALNISEENEVWFYFYTEFYICRLTKNMNTEYWKSDISGAHMLLISYGFVLIDQGYNEQSKYELFRIENNQLKKIGVYEFLDESGYHFGWAILLFC